MPEWSRVGSQGGLGEGRGKLARGRMIISTNGSPGPGPGVIPIIGKRSTGVGPKTRKERRTGKGREIEKRKGTLKPK